MRIRTSRVKGAKAEYKETRGPTGAAFRRWRSERGQRYLERFGLDVAGDPAEAAKARRRMRNARKQERAAGV